MRRVGRKKGHRSPKQTSQTSVTLAGNDSWSAGNLVGTGSHRLLFCLGFGSFRPNMVKSKALLMQFARNRAEVSLQPARPLGCAMWMTFITKPFWLEETAKCFPSEFRCELVHVLSQSLVASISLPGSEASRDPGISRWLYKRILLPQNNHQVKWKPWPILQIWTAIRSVSMLECLGGCGSKSSLFRWPWLGSPGKSGFFMLPLVFCFAWSGNTCFEKGGRCWESWMQNRVKAFPWNVFNWSCILHKSPIFFFCFPLSCLFPESIPVLCCSSELFNWSPKLKVSWLS